MATPTPGSDGRCGSRCSASGGWASSTRGSSRRWPGVDEVLIQDVDACPGRGAAPRRSAAGSSRTPREAIRGVGRGGHRGLHDRPRALVEAAVEAGKPMLVEKPLAFDLDETIELVRLVEVDGGRAPARLPAAVRPRLPGGQAARRRRRARRRLPRPADRPRPHAAARRLHPRAPAACSATSSIHDFDALRWITGQEVVEVYADGAVRHFESVRASTATSTRARSSSPSTTARSGRSARRATTRAGTTSGWRSWARPTPSRWASTGGRRSGRSSRACPRRHRHGWDSFLDRFEAAYREELDRVPPGGARRGGPGVHGPRRPRGDADRVRGDAVPGGAQSRPARRGARGLSCHGHAGDRRSRACGGAVPPRAGGTAPGGFDGRTRSGRRSRGVMGYRAIRVPRPPPAGASRPELTHGWSNGGSSVTTAGARSRGSNTRG